jgi:hypothetical protein
MRIEDDDAQEEDDGDDGGVPIRFYVMWLLSVKTM